MVSGSSPLTRGKLRLGGLVLRRARLIPAHAGKTLTRCQAPLKATAHPRSRGENRWPRGWPAGRAGSSPLTRGKPSAGMRHPALPWLIPAHAGKTLTRCQAPLKATAHPRSRGENRWPRGWPAGRAGSSPLTRGKPSAGMRHPALPWLIPAHAGKTVCRPIPSACAVAHPRSRGENARISRAVSAGDGSSPLTRGKHGANLVVNVGDGLIPAHAGKTGAVWLACGACAAHPRSRGENRCEAVG